MSLYHVVWTTAVTAETPEDAALLAAKIQQHPEVSHETIFHVREDVDSRTLVDDELTERGYKAIDVEEVEHQEEIGRTLQALLCSPWNVPQLANVLDAEVIGAVVIVDPEGVAEVVYLAEVK